MVTDDTHHDCAEVSFGCSGTGAGALCGSPVVVGSGAGGKRGVSGCGGACGCAGVRCVLQTILNYAGIAVFACSGATVGVRKGFDWFGIATLGVVTGVGGGVLRDVLLDIPPQSIQRWPNITVALIAVAVVTPFAKVVIRMNRSVVMLDAVGVEFFSSSGAAIAVDVGASWFAAGLAGMLTAIAGGCCATYSPGRCLA